MKHKGLVALCHLARKWTGTYCTPTEARTVQTWELYASNLRATALTLVPFLSVSTLDHQCWGHSSNDSMYTGQ